MFQKSDPRWVALAALATAGWFALDGWLTPRVSPDALSAALGMTVCAIIGALAVMKARARAQNRERLTRERQRERAEVSAEAATDAVRALELKVAALEKALDAALTRGSSTSR